MAKIINLDNWRAGGMMRDNYAPTEEELAEMRSVPAFREVSDHSRFENIVRLSARLLKYATASGVEFRDPGWAMSACRNTAIMLRFGGSFRAVEFISDRENDVREFNGEERQSVLRVRA